MECRGRGTETGTETETGAKEAEAGKLKGGGCSADTACMRAR